MPEPQKQSFSGPRHQTNECRDAFLATFGAPVDETGAPSAMAVSARRCRKGCDTDASSAVGFDAEVDATEEILDGGEMRSVTSPPQVGPALLELTTGQFANWSSE